MQPTSANDPSAPAGNEISIQALEALKPDLCERAWQSVPHPTLPLIATSHAKNVTVYSLTTSSSHSTLTGGHTRSVRCAAWKPGLPPHKLCLVSGSFDATAGIWRWDGDQAGGGGSHEREITSANVHDTVDSDDDEKDDKDWEFTLVLEGHDSEIKSCAFSPSGAHLATSSRDKSVWIWEDIGATEEDDEWETIAVLNEHEGDVKAVEWCPDVPGRNSRRRYGTDVLASASYDNTVRIWREDNDGEWVCVAVLEGHGETVWGVQWEPAPRNNRFPRLLTFSADATMRIWTLKDDDEDDEMADGGGAGSRSALGGIPNTMRRSLREEWTCTAILPKGHTRDIYSATWSKDSGLVASTGGDGQIVLYKEMPEDAVENGQADVEMTNGGGDELAVKPPAEAEGSGRWKVVGKKENAHGPYEVNHITWCRRHDAAAERRGEEEMLVTTGDDGVVQPWQVGGL